MTLENKKIMTSLTIVLAITLMVTLGLSQEAEASHPRQLTATGLEGYVELDWNPSTKSSVIKYKVEYKETGDSTWILKGTTRIDEYNVRSLTNGQSYDFKVTSQSETRSYRSATASATPMMIASTSIDKPIGLKVIPQDRKMFVDWYQPSSGTSPTDYVIKYKRADQTSWITVQSSGIGTEKTINGLYNNQYYQFKVASKAGSQTSVYTGEVSARPTDNCDQTGADNTAHRCYATQQYDFKHRSSVKAIKGIINFDDKNITSGFNQASLWLIFSDRPKSIAEVGITDNTSSIKFVCAEDGYIKSHRFASTPSDNTDYNFEITKIGRTNTWQLIANGENCGVITTHSKYNTPDLFMRGTETSKNNTPDFIQEFKELKFKRYSTWKSLSSTYGTDSRAGLAHDFFIEKCGNGAERLYHIETGKGTSRNC